MGIGTFRGSGGAWSGIMGRISLVWGGTPLGWKWTPGLVWSRFVNDFYSEIATATPHAGLLALADLQREHFGDHRMAFVTMNVDGLHQLAGAQAVSEVHGTVRKFRCMKCRAPMRLEPPIPASPQPRCSAPGCNGRVRPCVTLFTEGLPADEWIAAQREVSLLGPGDVILVVGTSSVVYPAASLPEEAVARGATLIEFNLQMPTPLSELAHIGVEGSAKETLRECVDSVLRRTPMGSDSAVR